MHLHHNLVITLQNQKTANEIKYKNTDMINNKDFKPYEPEFEIDFASWSRGLSHLSSKKSKDCIEVEIDFEKIPRSPSPELSLGIDNLKNKIKNKK